MKESTADYRLLHDGRVRTYHRGPEEVGGGVSEFYRGYGDTLFYERSIDMFGYTESHGVLEYGDGTRRYFLQSEYGREEFYDWDHAPVYYHDIMRIVIRKLYMDEAEADTVGDDRYRSIAMENGILVSADGTVEYSCYWPDRPVVAEHKVMPLEQADEGQTAKALPNEQEHTSPAAPADENAPVPEKSMAEDSSTKKLTRFTMRLR